MAIKNLFGRGIGLTDGAVGWVVTRGYGAVSVESTSYTIMGPIQAYGERVAFTTPSARMRVTDPAPRFVITNPDAED